MAQAESQRDEAKARTELAEDRTVLANERTFAGWMRTGMAAVGIGIAFNALFTKMEPEWLPRLIASVFIMAGVLIFYLAEHNATALLTRLDAHTVEPQKRMNLRLVALVMAGGSLALLAGLWLAL